MHQKSKKNGQMNLRQDNRPLSQFIHQNVYGNMGNVYRRIVVVQ